ncbi:MAG: pilus assembly protein [Azospirillaceae bacterium]
MTIMGIRRAAGLGRRLARDRRGAIIVELAYALPVFTLLVLGCVELSRYVLLHQKLQRTTVTVADLMTRHASWTEDEITDMFFAVSHVATPFDMATRGIVILSGLTTDSDGDVIVAWQRSGAGGLAAASEIGSAGQQISPPDGLVINDGEVVVVAEVKYDFDPLLVPMLDSEEPLYNRVFFRPRRGGLDTLGGGGG